MIVESKALAVWLSEDAGWSLMIAWASQVLLFSLGHVAISSLLALSYWPRFAALL